MQNYFLIIFLWAFPYYLLYFADKLKKPTILPEIVGFLKVVGEMQHLVREGLQNYNYDAISHYTLLPIYPFHFPKFCPIQKQ